MGAVFLFSIGGSEVFFILLVVVMLFGSKRIPEIARGLGKGIREVRNAANDVKHEINKSTAGDKDLQRFREKVEKEKEELKEITCSVKRDLDI